MQKPSLYLATLLLTGMLVCLPISNEAFLSAITYNKKTKSSFLEEITSKPEQKTPNHKAVVKQAVLEGIPQKQIGGLGYYRLDDLTAKGIIQGKTDKENEVCLVQKGKHHLRLERNIPVILDSGLYKPMTRSPVFIQNECYLPEETVENIVALTDGSDLINLLAKQKQVAGYNAKQLANYLSFLRSPIQGAHVSTKDSSLPGAPRPYRNGVHEGLDWYTFGTGTVIDKNTPVFSMGSGVVVRADTNYREMTPPERNKLLAIGSKNNGQTPPYILDKLRGQTVWVQFENGVMARYCHLSRIAKDINVGTKVEAGDLIGYVGNSGTSDGAKHNNKGLHLHLDIMIYGNWLWGKYSVADRRMILETIFNQDQLK